MKLDNTLNFKKVRCVKAYDDCLKIGKEYDVIDISVEIKVKDDEGEFLYWESDRFEPVPDSAENPLQGVELTPEFEAAEPVLADNSVNIQDIGTDILDTNADIKDTAKFKVGDKVYFGAFKEVKTVSEVRRDNELELDGETGWINGDFCCHATQENYERLQATFPDIEFEQPPKPLTGNDLCIAMLKGKHINIMCQVDGNETNIRIITLYTGDFFYDRSGNRYSQVIPVDTTGEPLTESILND